MQHSRGFFLQISQTVVRLSHHSLISQQQPQRDICLHEKWREKSSEMQIRMLWSGGEFEAVGNGGSPGGFYELQRLRSCWEHRRIKLERSWSGDSWVHKMFNNQTSESFATCRPSFLKHNAERKKLQNKLGGCLFSIIWDLHSDDNWLLFANSTGDQPGDVSWWELKIHPNTNIQASCLDFWTLCAIRCSFVNEIHHYLRPLCTQSVLNYVDWKFSMC